MPDHSELEGKNGISTLTLWRRTMKRVAFMMGITALLCGDQAFGDDIESKVGMRKSEGFGPAGCGLGSLIFEPDSGFTQVFAATTNGTLGSQTFGISTGTSNCDDTRGSKESARAYVETNRAALAKDIARGRGETIHGLAELAGCRSSNATGRTLQKSFKEIFPSAKVTDGQVSENVLRVLKRDSSLACGNLT